MRTLPVRPTRQTRAGEKCNLPVSPLMRGYVHPKAHLMGTEPRPLIGMQERVIRMLDRWADVRPRKLS